MKESTPADMPTNAKVHDPAQQNAPVYSKKDRKSFRHTTLKTRRRRRRLIAFALVVVLLALAAVPVYRTWVQPYMARSLYESLRTMYGVESAGSMPEEYNPQLGALYDINPDIGGWLIVPGSDVNLPVVRTVQHDAVYYVNHLFDGAENPCGTPYFLAEPHPERARYNTVIRGDRLLMGQIGGYRDLAFYRQAPLLFLDTLSDAYMYKIFAVVDVTDEEAAALSHGGFLTDRDFYDFVARMGDRSLITTGIRVTRSDRLLTLLCDTDAGKLAVVARAVREDEDYAVDTAMATAHTPGQPAAVTQTDVTPTGP